MAALLLKVLAAAVIGSLLGLLLKKERPEMSLMIGIAVSSLILFMSIEILERILAFLRTIADSAGISETVLVVVFKTTGISLLTKFIADICKESDKQSAASAVEFIGAACAVYVALPLFQTVIEMLNELL